MSNAKHETLAEIVADMRKDIAEGTVGIWSDFGGEIARSYADRIEVAHRCFYDKYKEHTDELNREILVLKREKEMHDTYFCGYDPEEALVAQCSTCRFFQKKYSHCKLHDSLTNAKYKCSGWKFKTNKECADEYNASRNHEVAELRAENARLRAALKPVLDIVMDSATSDLSMEMAIMECKRIYNEYEIDRAIDEKEGDTK